MEFCSGVPVWEWDGGVLWGGFCFESGEDVIKDCSRFVVCSTDCASQPVVYNACDRWRAPDYAVYIGLCVLFTGCRVGVVTCHA